MIKRIIILLICILSSIVAYRVVFSLKEKKNTEIILEVSSINQSSVLNETSKITPTLIPTPSLTPRPTEIPFSVLAPTILMSFEEKVGDNGVYLGYDDIKDKEPPDTYKIVLNLFYQFITIYKKDEKGKFTIPVRYILCSTGEDKDGNSTPLGEFEIGEIKDRFGEFYSYGGPLFAQYWTQLTKNYYFHSVLYSRRNAYYYRAYSYENLGKKASHGCIRMTVPDARWIWYHIAPGTLAEVIEGKEDPALASIKEKLLMVNNDMPEIRPEILKEAGNIPVTEAWPDYTGRLTPIVKEKNQESAIGTVSPQNQE